MRIVNHAAGKAQHAAVAVDETVGRERGGFESGRKRDDLEDGTRLERHRHRVILAIGHVLRFRGVIGVVGRITGQRQDFARVGVHHDDAAAGGMVGLDRDRQLALGDELNPLVDAEDDRQAGPRLGSQGGFDAAALDVGQQPHLAGLAAKVLVERLLDAGVALLFEIDRAEHVRGQAALGIVALAFPLEADPFQAEAVQSVRLLVGDAPLDDQVAAVVLIGREDLAVEFHRIEMERPGQNFGRHLDVHLLRVDVDGFGRRAHGEYAARAVE